MKIILADIWKELERSCAKGKIEIQTIRRNGNKGLWFKIMMENQYLIVDKSEDNNSCIKIKMPRKISKNEFYNVSKYYKRWRQGDILRSDISKVSMNTSYIFAVLNYFS